MKKQVTERVLALVLSVAIMLSSMGIYSVNATQVNTAGATSVTESSTAAKESVTDTAETTALLEGKGTVSDPYKIAKVSDFAAMQKIIDNAALSEKNFELTADIDFSEVSAFTPIKGFTGSFNGNGHVIKNFTVNEDGSAGLFATIGGSEGNVAEFRNIVIENAYVKGGNCVGALAGFANAYTLIDNCKVINSVVSGSTVGGLVGYISGGKVNNSSADVTVEGNDVAGGLAGMTDAVITNSFSYGKINAKISDVSLAGVGGLVGVIKSGEVKTSASLADVTVSAIANCSDENAVAGIGGFAGVAQGTVIENSFSAGKVTVTGADAIDANCVAGVGGLVGISMIEIKSTYSSSAVSVDFAGKAEGNSVRTVGGLVGASYENVSDSYSSGGVVATLNRAIASQRDCYVGGIIGCSSGADYKNLYYDKTMNNNNTLKAISNVENETVLGLTTSELIEGNGLSSAFAFSADAYPYLKSMTESENGIYATVLSIVSTTVSPDDKSAALGVGASKVVTLPGKITLASKDYALTWSASESSVIDGQSADIIRTGALANYMTLAVSIGGVSRTYSRLFTDIGSFEAAVGNVSVSYNLTNKSGDNYMDSALVGILIKSELDTGNVVASDIFTSADAKASKLNNIIVTSDGFYVNSNISQGYKLEVIAKDSVGNALQVTDEGNKGFFVATGGNTAVVLEISIVKTETPWGINSIWESLIR